MRRDFLVLMVGMLVLFGAPASALGAISAVNVTVTPSTLVAGAHPNVTVDEKFTYTGGDSVKDTTLHFPPGLLGNPQATPLCTQAAFQNGGACPANTTLGSTTHWSKRPRKAQWAPLRRRSSGSLSSLLSATTTTSRSSESGQRRPGLKPFNAGRSNFDPRAETSLRRSWNFSDLSCSCLPSPRSTTLQSHP